MSSFLSSFVCQKVQQCGVPLVVFPDRIGDKEIYRKFGKYIEEAVTVTLDRILRVNSIRTPPNSCKHLTELRPDLPPGYYWIKSSKGMYVKIFCDSAWSRITFLNMTDPAHECPPTWKEITSPKRTCSKFGSTYTCDSATFSTHGLRYNHVKGRIIGYQHGRTYAFSFYNQQVAKNVTMTIDTYYLDGVSVTHGSPRKHIWSFASDLCEQCRLCPCTGSDMPPPWVGDNYFCESGTTSIVRPPWPDVLMFADDPLWDGKGCGPNELMCCMRNNPPWFSVTTDEVTDDDIEIRICGTINSSMDTPVELIELYVQ